MEGQTQKLEDESTWITQKWTLLGGAPVMGSATSVVVSAPGGAAKYQTFGNGVIVYSSDFGAVRLSHVLFQRWLATQSESAADGSSLFEYLGLPVRDYDALAGHDDAAFERGMIVAEPGPVSHVVYGDIYGRYLDLAGTLGRPRGEQGAAANGGRFQVFEFGEIYSKPGLGAYGSWGPILAHWKSTGGAAGPLGYPKSDPASIIDGSGAPLGVSGRFEGAVTFYSGATGAHDLSGSLLVEYETRYGGPAGSMGFPIGVQGVSGVGDPFMDFEGGVLVDHVANDPYHGILAFGDLDFYVERVALNADDCWQSICGDLDLYYYVKVDTSTDGRVVDVRRPAGDGDFDDDQHDAREAFALTTARSDLTVNAWLQAWDLDADVIFTVPDDWFGDHTQTYSIDNLWGLSVDMKHEASTDDGESTAWFTVRNHPPYDHNDRLGALWWSFDNFKTPELSWDQFAQSFADVSPDEAVWRHPFNHLYYSLAYKKIAKNGNCFGMTLESIYAEHGQSPYSEPLFQYFPDTADGRKLTAVDGQHASLINQLNVKMGYQLGANSVAWSIASFLSGVTHNPLVNYAASGAAHLAGEYPLLSIFDDYIFGGGHSVRPYKWGTEGSCSWTAPGCLRMEIYDPNEPLSSPQGAAPDRTPDAIEIDPSTNYYRYRDYSGGEWFGGRMFWQPFRLFAHKQVTPFANPLELLESGMLVVVGSDGKMNQVTDHAGRTLFQKGLSGPPTRWDEITRNDAERVPDLAPVVTTDIEGGMPVQIYGGYGTGSTHTYELVLAPGKANGTPYEASVETGKLSTHVTIPGTSGVPDTLVAHDIGMPERAIELALPANSQTKNVAWTIAGAQKQRWAELSDMKMVPTQKINVQLAHAGYHLLFDNDGPATSAILKVKAGPGAPEVTVGRIDIPSGSGTLEFERPVTELVLSGQVNGKNGWLLAPVTVTLNAKDLSGTGIASVEYSRDAASWTSYSGPFVYADEGANNLYYRAQDKALNQERTKSRQLKIDSKKPSSTGTLSTASGVKLSYAATDPVPGSGVSGLHTIVEGTAGGYVNTFTPGKSGTVSLPTKCSAVEFWSEDMAGNEQAPHVQLKDSVAPTFTFVPGEVRTTHCTASAGLTLGQAKAVDDCRGTVTITNDAPSKFPLGTTTVTWKATDAAGNVRTATQRVIAMLGDDESCCPSGTKVLKGTNGPDQMLGTAASECFLGLGGPDQIEGRGGNDFMSGGAGDDNITGGDGREYIWGWDGRDVIDAQGGNDYVDGGGDFDSCSSGTGVDGLYSCENAAFCTAACCAKNSCDAPPAATP